MATSSSLPLFPLAIAALECEDSLSFLLGQLLAKCPSLPHMKHWTLDRFFFFFPCYRCPFDVRASSSSSSFFTLTLPLLNSFLVIVQISSCRRIAHMSPQFGSCALPKMPSKSQTWTHHPTNPDLSICTRPSLLKLSKQVPFSLLLLLHSTEDHIWVSWC